MEFMPFNELSDQAFCELFPKNYETAYDDSTEWVYFNGEWYPCAETSDETKASEGPLDYEDPDADDIYDLDYAGY